MILVEKAAIKMEDGKVYSVPRPGRHHDCIKLIASLGYKIPIIGEQGFVLSDGTFADRIYARKVADEANQGIARDMHLDELFSEDLWEGSL
jgi:hypothetical protein